MSFLKTMLASMLGTFITIVVIIFLAFMILLGIILAATSEEVAEVSPKTILTLNLDHQIADRAPSDFRLFNPLESSKVTGLNDILDNIRKAKTDENIVGIYLNTENIPAGAATIGDIRNALLDFSESEKFIIAYGNFYSQPAYYLASVADLVCLNPQGGLLFKGLNAELVFLKGTLEKLDVDVQIIRHGRFKAATEPLFLDKMSPENRHQTTEIITDIWNEMVGSISESRNIPPVELNRIADQLLAQTAEEARSLNLVDTLLYKDQLLALLEEQSGIDTTERLRFISLSQYRNVPAKKPSVREKVAVVYAEGSVVDGEGSENEIGGERISRAIRKAREDKQTKAIVLRVNSGGGSALASEVIWREVELAVKEKPVVASFGDVAASGGYYIACAATKIMTEPGTITGSIGVWAAIPNLQGLMSDKLGITTDEAKTNENADFISVTKPLTPYQIARLQDDVEHIYSVFTQRVSDGRYLPVTYVDSIGEGRIWSGTAAVRLGLADTTGGLTDAIRLAARLAGLEEYKVSDLPVLKEPLQQLLEELTGQSAPEVAIHNLLGTNYRYYKALKGIQSVKGIQARIPVEIMVY